MEMYKVTTVRTKMRPVSDVDVFVHVVLAQKNNSLLFFLFFFTICSVFFIPSVFNPFTQSNCQQSPTSTTSKL